MPSVIRLKSPFIEAAFSATTGEWLALRALESDLIQPPAPAFDLVVEGNLFPYNVFVDQREHVVKEARRSLDGRSCEIEFEYEGIRLTQIVELDVDEPLLRQKIRVECIDGFAPRKLTAVHYYLPNFCIGDPAECYVQAPGQHIPIDTPYAERARMALDRRYREPLPGYPTGWLQPAPDETCGLIAVENRGRNLVASSWLYSEIATTFPTIDGTGTYLSTEHRHQLALWLKPGASVTSGEYCILVTEGSLEDHLKAFRSIAYKNLVSVTDGPAWRDTARLLQIPPYPIKPVTAQLRKYRDIGFNVIYLNPVQDGRWYGIQDHYKIGSQVGTAEELKEFVASAHAEGLKVLFDFIPQGIGASSPFVQQHPDWLVRDELERPFGSHGWGSRPGAPLHGTLSLDWGNPEYRKFAIEWALWYVKTFDIDGFRTDAMHWKEANFSFHNPRPAWHTTFGGIRLGEELRAAVHCLKPDFLLLSEVWGPIFQRSHDATYENGWLLEGLNRGWFTNKPLFTARQYSRYLAMAGLARPAGTRRANFTANHDMTHLVDLGRNSPLGNAVTFVHGMNEGIPFVWHEEVSGREDFYTGLLENRKSMEGYSVDYLAVKPDNDAVFASLWTKEGCPSIVALANLSPEKLVSECEVPFAVHQTTARFGSENVTVSPAKNGLLAELPAGGYSLQQLG